MSAGLLVRTARQRAGLSQRALASRAGTSQPAVARYEAGSVVPRADTLERLLEACGRQVSTRPGQPRESMRFPGPRGRQLRRLRSRVLEIAAGLGLQKVRVFGSVARGTDDSDSDIDLLVDVLPGEDVLVCQEFAELLRPLLGIVDVTTERLLRDKVRHAVEAEAVTL